VEVVIRRDVMDGRIWSAQPHHVISRDGGIVWAGVAPGTPMVAPTRWCDWVRGTGERQSALDALLRREWRMEVWEWRWTTLVRRFAAESWWTATAVFSADDGAFQHWYVDVHRPLTVRGALADTFDLLLDAVIPPDGELRWKDEDELEQAVQTGLFTPADVRGVKEARADLLDLVAHGELFGTEPPDPAAVRPVSELPAGWDADVNVDWT
jgi:hypothetical protein